jgi:thymidylate synthase
MKNYTTKTTNVVHMKDQDYVDFCKTVVKEGITDNTKNKYCDTNLRLQFSLADNCLPLFGVQNMKHECLLSGMFEFLKSIQKVGGRLKKSPPGDDILPSPLSPSIDNIWDHFEKLYERDIEKHVDRTNRHFASFVDGLPCDLSPISLSTCSWNPCEYYRMQGNQCRIISQVIKQGDKLNCFIVARRANLVTMPVDVTSYAMLVHLLARTSNLDAGEIRLMVGHGYVCVGDIDAIDLRSKKENCSDYRIHFTHNSRKLNSYKLEHIQVKPTRKT